MGIRGAMSGRAMEKGRTCKAKSTFIREATIVWNRAPIGITKAETLSKVKKKVKKFSKTLPV